MQQMREHIIETEKYRSVLQRICNPLFKATTLREQYIPPILTPGYIPCKSGTTTLNYSLNTPAYRSKMRWFLTVDC